MMDHLILSYSGANEIMTLNEWGKRGILSVKYLPNANLSTKLF